MVEKFAPSHKQAISLMKWTLRFFSSSLDMWTNIIMSCLIVYAIIFTLGSTQSGVIVYWGFVLCHSIGTSILSIHKTTYNANWAIERNREVPILRYEGGVGKHQFCANLIEWQRNFKWCMTITSLYTLRNVFEGMTLWLVAGKLPIFHHPFYPLQCFTPSLHYTCQYCQPRD